MTSIFLPATVVAVLLHVELDRGVDLLAGRGLVAGHRQDQADLHGVLREDTRESTTAQRGSDQEFAAEHLFSSRRQFGGNPYLWGSAVGKPKANFCFG